MIKEGKEIEGNGSKKKIIILLGVFIVCCSTLFAASQGISALDSFAEKGMSLLTSPFVRFLFVVAIIIAACVGAWGWQRGATAVVTGMIVIIVCLGLAMSAPSIVNWAVDGIEIEQLK